MVLMHKLLVKENKDRGRGLTDFTQMEVKRRYNGVDDI